MFVVIANMHTRIHLLVCRTTVRCSMNIEHPCDCELRRFWRNVTRNEDVWVCVHCSCGTHLFSFAKTQSEELRSCRMYVPNWNYWENTNRYFVRTLCHIRWRWNEMRCFYDLISNQSFDGWPLPLAIVFVMNIRRGKSCHDCGESNSIRLMKKKIYDFFFPYCIWIFGAVDALIRESQSVYDW